ncbi:MAG: hypothetical protein ACLFOY_05275 [Desulfatibacillaceae bacterium]
MKAAWCVVAILVFLVPAVPGVCGEPVRSAAVPEGEVRPALRDATVFLTQARVRKTGEGFAVVSAEPDSLLARFGLKSGDVILSVCGVPLESLGSYLLIRDAARFGGEVELAVDRNGLRETVAGVVLDGGDQEPVAPYPSLCALFRDVDLAPVEYMELSGEKVAGLRVDSLAPGTFLRNAGVDERDLLTRVNRSPLREMEDAGALYQLLSAPGPVELHIWRRGAAFRLSFDLLENNGLLTFANLGFHPVR